MSEKKKDGIDMTVYRIAKGFLYLADDNGKKYKVANIMGSMAHVGMRLRSVVFADKAKP